MRSPTAERSLATASFQGGEPGERLAGVRRATTKHPPMPRDGFKSQADMERYMRQTMHTVPDIDDFYERTVTLNRRAWKVGVRLRVATGLEGPQTPPPERRACEAMGIRLKTAQKRSSTLSTLTSAKQSVRELQGSRSDSRQP